MKKFIKNNLLGFILGAIIFSGIGAYAEYIITADKVEYAPNISIKDKVDDLYTKVKPSYTEATSITPSTTMQTLQTNNKLLNSDITINPIPSTYKNLTTTTDVNANNLLSGVKAYTSDGTLVTGNVSTDCVSGSFVVTQNYIDNGITLANFKPNYFAIYSINDSKKYIWYFNKNIGSSNYYAINLTSSAVNNYTLSSSAIFVLNNNSFFVKPANGLLGQTAYYMVCK